MHKLKGENGILYEYAAGDSFVTAYNEQKPDNPGIALAVFDLYRANIMVEEQCRKASGDMLKVFISQPFTDCPGTIIERKKNETVKRAMEAIRQDERFDEFPDDKIIIFDQYHQPVGPAGCSRVYYLGNSIKMMDEADIVVFADNAMSAKGCVIEKVITMMYPNNFMKVIDFGENKEEVEKWISNLISLMK